MSAPHSKTDNTAEGVRLSRRVAELKGCSRREAEQYIEGGWVRVAGQVTEMPQYRVHDESVVIDPHASLGMLAPVTLLLNKPPAMPAGAEGGGNGADLLTAGSHASGDRSRIVPLRRHFARQMLCTPLENEASGLVVFTQNRHIARRLSEDAAFIEQEFTVDIEGVMSPADLQRLQQPDAGAGVLPIMKISLASTRATHMTLRFAFKGNHPGLVATWCNHAGLRVSGMRRIRIGRIPLASLPCGQWRYLLPHERF